jgi:ABC-type nickel/cobalt efflux system permease component RcnA
MLIFIAVITLAFEFDIIHRHKHVHSHEETKIEKEHTHVHTHILNSNKKDHGAMLGIGFIHGIASNDELLVLFTLTFGLNDLITILVGVLIFSVGVITGMILYGFSLNYPIQKWGTKKVSRYINVVIAGISLIYAGWLLAGLNGLNLFELL